MVARRRKETLVCTVCPAPVDRRMLLVVARCRRMGSVDDSSDGAEVMVKYARTGQRGPPEQQTRTEVAKERRLVHLVLCDASGRV
jgi:hypothetical protein